MILDQDTYSTVINSQKTYEGIAAMLKAHNAACIAWTDQEGTQLDLLFAYKPVGVGFLQRGMSVATDLFVGVSNFGMFGFELNGLWKSPGYVGSKLGLGGNEDDTTKALSELINAVCKELQS